MTAEIGRKARASVKITFAATVVQGLLQAAILVVLARLLDPRDYGYYAIGLSISLMTTGLVSMSIERALVVSPDAAENKGRAIPIMLLLALVSVVVVAAVALVAQRSGWSVEPGVLAVICAAHTIAGLSVVPRVLLRRDLSFGRIVAGELCGQVIGGGVVAIALALAGYGPYALAVGFLTQNLVNLAVLLIQSRQRFQRPRFDGLGPLVRSAIELGKVGSLEVLHVQLPALVLSARFGAAPLGLFNRVANLVTLPLQLLTSSMSRVMVSAMVAVAAERERLARATGLVLRVSTAIVTPLAFGIAGSAGAFTEAVLGAKWMAAAPLVPVLALATWAALTAHILATLAEAMREFAAKIRIQIVTTGCLLGGLLIGSDWGLVGAAWGMALSSLVFLVLNIGLASRILAVRQTEILGWMAPGLGAGLACFAGATAVGHLFAEAAWLVLAAQIGVCIASTAIFYLLFDRSLLDQARTVILPTRAAGT